MRLAFILITVVSAEEAWLAGKGRLRKVAAQSHRPRAIMGAQAQASWVPPLVLQVWVSASTSQVSRKKRD